MGRRPKAPIEDPELERLIAVAEPSRWAMLRLLSDRPRSVGEVAEAVGLSLPVASRHLQRLRACGLVSAERHGKSLVCALSESDTAGGLWLTRTLGEVVSARSPARPVSQKLRRRDSRPGHTASRPVVSSPPRQELDDYLL